MTSPSWPVSVRPPEPLPFIALASTNSTSPPVPVTARPVATPGTAVRAAASWKTFWRPSASRTASRSTVDRRLARCPDAIRVAVLRSSVPSSRSSWRTPASRVYSATTSRSIVVGDLDLVLAQAVALALARPQVVAGDRDLLGRRCSRRSG